MKIPEMTQREDFYHLCEKTLNRYFVKTDNKTIMYVYPKLNAIVTSRPSKDIINYLIREYQAKNKFKTFLIQIYIKMCMHTFGLMASRKIVISSRIDDDVLVYPCNKKIRVFKFSNSYVDVIVKDGFPTELIRKEIKFRSNMNRAPFIPGLLDNTNDSYREAIIKGTPLPRLRKNIEQIKQSAYRVFKETYSFMNHEINALDYFEDRQKYIVEKINEIRIESNIVQDILGEIRKHIQNKNVIVGMSHGDLQSGNIWVEDDTQKIYIIDWETWGIRSIQYDYNVLFCKLRPGSIADYLFECQEDDHDKSIVLLDDICFRIDDSFFLPSDIAKRYLERYFQEISLYFQKKTGIIED